MEEQLLLCASVATPFTILTPISLCTVYAILLDDIVSKCDADVKERQVKIGECNGDWKTSL